MIVPFLRFGYYEYLSPDNWVIVAYDRYFKASPPMLVRYQLVNHTISSWLFSSSVSFYQHVSFLQSLTSTDQTFILCSAGLPYVYSPRIWVSKCGRKRTRHKPFSLLYAHLLLAFFRSHHALTIFSLHSWKDKVRQVSLHNVKGSNLSRLLQCDFGGHRSRIFS